MEGGRERRKQDDDKISNYISKYSLLNVHVYFYILWSLVLFPGL